MVKLFSTILQNQQFSVRKTENVKSEDIFPENIAHDVTIEVDDTEIVISCQVVHRKILQFYTGSLLRKFPKRVIRWELCKSL